MAAANQEIQQLVTFRLDHEEFGIPIMDVHEIIFVPAITSIAKAPNTIVGVVNLRGEIIPILDLRIAFLKGKGETSKKQRIIVTEAAGQVIGLLVDQVAEVLRLDSATLEALPPALQTVNTKYMKCICKISDRLIVLLNLESLLTNDEQLFVHSTINQEV